MYTNSYSVTALSLSVCRPTLHDEVQQYKCFLDRKNMPLTCFFQSNSGVNMVTSRYISSILEVKNWEDPVRVS